MSKRFAALFCAAGIAAAAFAPAMQAKDKKSKSPEPARDQIEVVGHVPQTDGPVRQFFVTPHYSSLYLYAERDTGKTITLMDVTRAGRPTVLGEVAAAPGQPASLSLVAGTAAVVASEPVAASHAPESIKIMDYSDPQNPKSIREFSGITALSSDEGRGLIFVANGEGIWILRKHLADDPEAEKSYRDYVLYGSR